MGGYRVREMKIFDGYNVIGAGGKLGLNLSQEDKEERLLRLLSSYRVHGRLRGRFLVVFDGHYGRLAEGPRRYTRGMIGVEWAVGESADAVIVRKVRKSSNPKGLEVITSDGEVLRKVRQARGRGTRSEDFLRKVEEVSRSVPEFEKPGPPSAGEVEEWLLLFGEKGRDEDPGDGRLTAPDLRDTLPRDGKRGGERDDKGR